MCKCRRTLTTGLSLATENQKQRVEDLFNVATHVPVQLDWSVYQRMVDDYGQSKPEVGRWALEQLIAEISTKVPKGLPELKKLVEHRPLNDFPAKAEHQHSKDLVAALDITAASTAAS